MQEFTVEFLYSRQQKIENFSRYTLLWQIMDGSDAEVTVEVLITNNNDVNLGKS